MRILIACEKSGVVREAFRRHGHDALSCDLEPSDLPGPHIQGDVRPLLRERWDMVIAHPPCTDLCQSGMPQFKRNPAKWDRVAPAAAFFLECLNANARFVAVENSILHRMARELLGRPSFVVSQRDFGGPGSKRACWWVKGLPPLMATVVNPDAKDLVSGVSGERRSVYASRFHEGMAEAMATQWGGLA